MFWLFLGLLAAVRAPGAVAEDRYEWHVTLASRAPDCFERPVILVNGEFEPALHVTQGDVVEINVFNDLPSNYPMAADGIAIHWHGFDMRGEAAWFDGTGTQGDAQERRRHRLLVFLVSKRCTAMRMRSAHYFITATAVAPRVRACLRQLALPRS